MSNNKFFHLSTISTNIICDEQYKQELLPIIAKIDTVMDEVQIVKRCIKTSISIADDFVIKRYNMFSWRYLLTRLFRPSRAQRNWVVALKMQTLGVKTASVLALVEHRYFWILRGRAYIITKKLQEHDISTWKDSILPEPTELNAIIALFNSMIHAKLNHGDMKNTNIIWHKGAWHLVDLDAARFAKNKKAFIKGYSIDRNRFLENFTYNSVLYKHLDAILPTI